MDFKKITHTGVAPIPTQEVLGEKEHVKAARKPRAKKTETKRKVTAHNPAFGMPYGHGPHYKTPCISRGVRDVLLGTTSGLTLSTMYNYNPAAIEQAAKDMRRRLEKMKNSLPYIDALGPRLSMRP